MESALGGIRIIDLTGMGPACISAMMLGDMGAEVVRVDPPPGVGSGGVGQGLPATGDELEQLRMTAHMASCRNKKSMMLNMKMEPGREVFKNLAQTADVVIEGFRPGVMDRMGVGYQSLSKVNERIIFCSVSGYGQDGPYRNFVGHDPDYSAMGGVMGLVGMSAVEPPVFAQNIMADMTAVFNTVIGILLALSARQKTGRGQMVDISMLDSAVFLSVGIPGLSEYFYTGTAPRRGETLLSGNQPFASVYRTKDDKYLTVCPIEARFWMNLCRTLGREDLIPHQHAVGAKKEEVIRELRDIFVTRTRDEWFQVLTAADVPAGKVLDAHEVFRDPQVLHRKMVLEMDDPQVGKVKQIGFPIKFSDTPGAVRTMPALPGQHTREILSGLGYAQDDVDALLQAGVVR